MPNLVPILVKPERRSGKRKNDGWIGGAVLGDCCDGAGDVALGFRVAGPVSRTGSKSGTTLASLGVRSESTL